jgi:enamine deaminase RidA (YjgF/YER057c/UK114 family)
MTLPTMRIETLHGRQCLSTGTRWEPAIGYSRAVRSGELIAVTGTIGINADGSISPSAEEQARQALRIVLSSIHALGGRTEDVVRTRIYVTDIRQWQIIGRVHAELLGHVRPATSMVEVSRLADEQAVVEIEADAVVREPAR